MCELERLLRVVRHRAKELVLNKKSAPTLTDKQISQYLGVPRFLDSRLPSPGVLAYYWACLDFCRRRNSNDRMHAFKRKRSFTDDW